MSERADFVVVGGGIAGVTCAQQLCFFNTGKSVRLVSAAPVLKVVAAVVKRTRNIEEITVKEELSSQLEKENDNLRVYTERVKYWSSRNKSITLTSGQRIEYGKLCICTGATPIRICDVPGVIVIRDTETVDDLKKRLAKAKSLAIIGNGGIACELVHNIQSCSIHWIIKSKSIATPFLDEGGARFLFDCEATAPESKSDCPVYKRLRYTVNEKGEKNIEFGTALGPDWAERTPLVGNSPKNVQIKYGCEVSSVSFDEETQKYSLELSTNESLEVDMIVTAIGVQPNPDCFGESLKLAEDGGILVNEKFQTSVEDVYAAGDVCSLENSEDLWFQMRLWTQARQMGDSAARSMTFPDQLLPPYFEVFGHATQFFGRKVIIIGQFKAESKRNDVELLLRVTPNSEYIKLVLCNNRMKGAILIGETDLEEVIENLHYTQLDLSSVKDNLLDPDIDLEDYFD